MTASHALVRTGLSSAAIALALLPSWVPAQEMDHSRMQMPMPADKPAPARQSANKPTEESARNPASVPAHAGHQATPAPDRTAEPKPSTEMDHSAMGHDMPMPANQREPVDHSAMQHDMGTMPREAAPMDHAAMGHGAKVDAPTEPRTPIPVVTDADRAAAVPPPSDHPVHDNSIQHYVVFDRLEAWDADPGTGLEWEGQGWIGTDLNRLWLRSEGEHVDGRTESANLEVLYGRSISRWWDLVAGVRHDFKPGASQDFAAIGVMGLAPYKFEVEATGYIGQSGQTAARFEVEYETLLTNRLILQPLVEVNFHGQSDERRGIGSGLSTAEAGLRLRYEITRQFAPYIGVIHERAFGRTADFRRNVGDGIDGTRIVAGIRIWF